MNDNAISKFPRAKYTASPVDHRKCEKKLKSYYAMNPFMFFDFTGPTVFWAPGESKLSQQTKIWKWPICLQSWWFSKSCWQGLEFSKSYRQVPELSKSFSLKICRILPSGNRAGKILKFLNLEILQILLTRSKTQTIDSVRWISCNTPLRITKFWDQIK